jgi:hypothetical protein
VAATAFYEHQRFFVVYIVRLKREEIECRLWFGISNHLGLSNLGYLIQIFLGGLGITNGHLSTGLGIKKNNFTISGDIGPKKG